MQPQSSPSPVPAPLDPAQLPAVPSAAPPVAPPSNQSPAATGSNSSTGPAQADDNDLIEKEWIAKVKQLVTSLADNPRELSKQFTLLKADYLQKRYGKDIKVEE